MLRRRHWNFPIEISLGVCAFESEEEGKKTSRLRGARGSRREG